MARPSKFKIVRPTLRRVDDFNEPKTLYSSAQVEWLSENPITVEKSGDFFSFDLENPVHQRTELTTKCLDKAFTEYTLVSQNGTFRCLPLSLQTSKYHIVKGHVSGTLNSLLDGHKKDFSNTYLRLIQPIKRGYSKVGNFTNAIDLNTDQKLMYGVGYLNLEIANLKFDILRISYRKEAAKTDQEFLFIDSCQKIEIEQFQNIANAFFQAYSFIFGILCGGYSYIVSSDSPEYKKIDNILFENKPKEEKHKNYLERV